MQTWARGERAVDSTSKMQERVGSHTYDLTTNSSLSVTTHVRHFYCPVEMCGNALVCVRGVNAIGKHSAPKEHQ